MNIPIGLSWNKATASQTSNMEAGIARSRYIQLDVQE